MFAWLTLPTMIGALATGQEPSTFVLAFEPTDDVLTSSGYDEARKAIAAFRVEPTHPVDPDRFSFLWVSDCGMGENETLEWAAEAELAALGLDPRHLGTRPNEPALDPCNGATLAEREIVVGVRTSVVPNLSFHAMPRIEFAKHSAQLSPRDLHQLRLATFYVNDRNWIEIEGHADPQEPGDIAETRAHVVRDAFARLGLKDWQMRTQGADPAWGNSVTLPTSSRGVSVDMGRTDQGRRWPRWWFDQRDAWYAAQSGEAKPPTPPAAD